MSTYLAQRLTHHERVTVHPRSELSAIHGTSRLSALNWRDHVCERDVRLEAAGLFLMIGADPSTTWLHEVGVELDAKGFVVTRDGFATSVPGVFAVGDVRAGSVKRVASAVGEGSVVMWRPGITPSDLRSEAAWAHRGHRADPGLLRDHPLPEAVRRPRGLPAPARRRLPQPVLAFERSAGAPGLSPAADLVT
jgi:hypothetical protein